MVFAPSFPPPAPKAMCARTGSVAAGAAFCPACPDAGWCPGGADCVDGRTGSGVPPEPSVERGQRRRGVLVPRLLRENLGGTRPSGPDASAEVATRHRKSF